MRGGSELVCSRGGYGRRRLVRGVVFRWKGSKLQDRRNRNRKIQTAEIMQTVGWQVL